MGWYRQSGDEWWLTATYVTQRSINIIEPAEVKDEPQRAHRVPFGFSRELAPEPVERDPLLWEGED